MENWAALLDSSSNIPTDITFKVVEKDGSESQAHVFKAHKMVLAVASPVFQAEFFGLAKETSDMILVQDTTKEAFETMIDHVYLKNVTLKASFHRLYEIVNLAEKYEMQSLMKKVVEHLEAMPLNSEEVVMEVTALAEMFPGFNEVSRSLLLRCASFMLTNVLKDINDIAIFTSKCCEDGRSSVALKLLSVIKDVSENKNVDKMRKKKPNTNIQPKTKVPSTRKHANSAVHPQQPQASTQPRSRSQSWFCRLWFFILLVFCAFAFVLLCLCLLLKSYSLKK